MLGRLRLLGRLAVGASAGAAGAGAYAYQTDEGVRRSLTFWSQALPIYAHYRWLQYVELPLLGIDLSSAESERRYEALHERYAPRVEMLALELRGFYLKGAQIVSTRDDLLPDAHLRWCKQMQAEVPTPFAAGESRQVIEVALGGPEAFNATFSEWDDEPLGAASIGVVHRARLAADSALVAVKVMMPGIEGKFRSDIRTVKRFCQLAMPQHVSALDEVEQQFFSEFDYCLEAANMEAIHANLMDTHWRKHVAVPRPYRHLCSREVLVMELLPGVKLDDGLRSQWERIAARRGLSLAELEAAEKRKPARPLGDRSLSHTLALWAIRASDLTANAARFGYNWTAGLALGRLPYAWSELPVELGSLLRLVAEVHAHELFEDGLFNGDPHPGNLLLMPDGRLGLVDYGQVKSVPLDFRLKYAKLIVALADGKNDEAVRIATEEIGLRTKRNDPEVLWRVLAMQHDRDTMDVTGGRNLQLFMEWAEAQDPMVYVPPDLVFPGRVTLMLRGLGNAFRLQLSVAKLWRAQAAALLREHGIDA
jgi:aarF domain-containing kinase